MLLRQTDVSAVLVMLARDQTQFPHLHLAYVHWVIIVQMAFVRWTVQLVHLVISLVQQVKLRAVHLVLQFKKLKKKGLKKFRL